MDILKIAGISILAAVMCLMIKKQHPEIAVQIGICAGIIILLFCTQYIAVIVDFISDISNKYAFAYDSIVLLLKIIGISYISEFTVQILKDAGENSVAAKVMLCSKIIIVVISLPILSSFLDMITEIAT